MGMDGMMGGMMGGMEDMFGMGGDVIGRGEPFGFQRPNALCHLLVAFNIRGRFVYFHQDQTNDHTVGSSAVRVTFDHAKPLLLDTKDHRRENEFKKHVLYFNRHYKSHNSAQLTRKEKEDEIKRMATSIIRNSWRLCFIVDAIELVERDKLPVIIATEQNTDIFPQIPEFAQMRKWGPNGIEAQLCGWRRAEEATILEFRMPDGKTQLVNLQDMPLTTAERRLLREEAQIE
jgi:hypothetical protein